MTIHSFDFQQQFSTIDTLADPRSEAQKQLSLLSSYNHGSPDLAYAERMAEEAVNISGAPIMVYKRRRNQRDEVWEEDADPTYHKGVRTKGFFVPEPAEISLTRYGVDVPNQTTVVFARAIVLKLFSHRMIAEGDILIVPHNTLIGTQFTDMRDGSAENRIDQYRVLKSGDTGNFKYRWLYWSCTVENVTGDQTIQIDFRQEGNRIEV
jgi:hypothetical protein